MVARRKCLIVNADDFGLSSGVNAGIIETHQHGILTSASLMVRWPAAAQAAQYARAHPELSVGLHLDLGEWSYVNEEWQMTYEVVRSDDAEAVSREVRRQLEAFQDLLGREPTHIDSHQHVHLAEPVLTVVIEQARRLGVPLRRVIGAVDYCGDFYGQSNKGYPYPEGISVEGLIRLFKFMVPGCVELGCHPAKAVDMPGMYRDERLVECETLCDPRVRRAAEMEGLSLCSFASYALCSGLG